MKITIIGVICLLASSLSASGVFDVIESLAARAEETSVSSEVEVVELFHAETLEELEAASDGESIKALSVRYLGRKGVVTQYLRNISNLPKESRPEAGKKANQTKKKLNELFKKALKRLEIPSYDTDNRIDVSLPGRVIRRGSLHPITQITQQICDIFIRLGFDVVEGPEVETDYYNLPEPRIQRWNEGLKSIINSKPPQSQV